MPQNSKDIHPKAYRWVISWNWNHLHKLHLLFLKFLNRPWVVRVCFPALISFHIFGMIAVIVLYKWTIWNQKCHKPHEKTNWASNHQCLENSLLCFLEANGVNRHQQNSWKKAEKNQATWHGPHLNLKKEPHKDRVKSNARCKSIEKWPSWFSSRKKCFKRISRYCKCENWVKVDGQSRNRKNEKNATKRNHEVLHD